MKFRTLATSILSATLFAVGGRGFGQAVIQVPGSGPNATTYIWFQKPKLRIGDPAPALTAAKWIKGKPLKFGNGKVSVVTFWSTWCVPSRETFEPLRAMSNQFKGKVNFVGVDVLEPSQDVEAGVSFKKAQAFVRERDRQMPYPIAIDDAQGTIAKDWLGMTNQNIPVAYVVDGAGRIVWIGHPLADLGEILPKVVNGAYDVDRAAKQQQLRIIAEGQMVETFSPIQAAVSEQRYKDAVAAIDRALVKTPSLESGLGPTKFQMLLRCDEPGAYAYAKTLAEGVCKNAPTSLNQLAWSIVEDDAGLKHPNYAIATELATRACGLTQYSDPYLLDTLALCYYRTGAHAKALDLQTKAVAIAEARKDTDEKLLGEMRSRLARFQKAGH